MDRVVTIHGIWTEGQWQENVAPVLWPHFEPVSVKYPYYRWLGPLDLVFEPLILLPGIACLVCLSELNRIHGRWLSASLWAGLLLLAFVVTFFRRQLVVNRFIGETSNATLAGRAPHIIAHSFGTYLTARALRESPFTRGDRIVLTGCVLNRRFGWEALLKAKPEVFQSVRNDVGRRDMPVFFAGLLQHLIPNFGAAGRYGFQTHPVSLHDITNCGAVCVSCTNDSKANVHNVYNDYGGHSTTFLGTNYAANYWLPFFWGIDPKEYDELLRLCWAIANYQELKPKLKQPGAHPSEPGALFEAGLYERKWGWAEGTFSGHIKKEILRLRPEYEEKPEQLNESVLSATLGVCLAVADAMEAQGIKLARKPRSKADRANYKSAEDVRIVALNPLQAVKRAVEELFAQEGKTS